MAVDSSIYSSNAPVTPFNPLTSFGDVQSIANAQQQNRLLQTVNQQHQLDLQNAQYQQQLGLLANKHTYADTGELNGAEFLADPASQAIPGAAKMVQDYYQSGGSPTTVLGKVNGAYSNIPTTKVGAGAMVQNQKNGGTNVPHATPFQLQQQQDMANAPQDYQDHFNTLTDASNDIHDVAINPKSTDKNVRDLGVKLVGTGVANAPSAANAILASSSPGGASGQQGINPLPLVSAAATKIIPARNALHQHTVNSSAFQQGMQTDVASPQEIGGADAQASQMASSQKTYQQVKEDAENIPQQLAAYNEVINLNNAGAKTGTSLAKMYKYVAQKVPGLSDAVTDKAAQTQAIGKYLSQGLIAGGMPTSDARLQELQSGNLNPDQLPETIKKLAPFFKASAQGAIDKQSFYNTKTNNGKDMSQEPAASQQWNQNYDPRWKEFDALSSNADKSAFLKEHPDMIANKQQYKNLKDMGVVDGYPGMK